VVASADTPVVQSLALRNLLRGARLGLPSYQDGRQGPARHPD